MSDATAPITPQQAAAELLHRRRARRSLAYYALSRGYWPAAHHLHLIDRLEAVARGESRRLMVFMPPGHAKSTYTSVLFPAWLQSQRTPHGMPWDVLGASNTAELAEDFSRKARSMLRDSSVLLGVGLSDDSSSVTRWETTAGGVYRCAGVGGTVTGKRADVAIIDDPIRSAEQADSDTTRDKQWSWYLQDLRTRLKPDAAIILVMTRWHTDDLAGRILPETWDGQSGAIEARDGETWEVVCLPALCDSPADPLGRDPGEALWPEWMPRERLEQERRSQTPRAWAALYQQRPTVEAGDYLQREWLHLYDEEPRGLRCFLASDFAVSARESADWTVHQVWGVDARSELWLVDQWREHALSDRSVDAALDLAARWRVAAWIGESGVIEAAIGPLIAARMRERGVIVRRELVPTIGDKQARARALQARASQGMVHLPRRAPWIADLMREWLAFPTGSHDDQVDPAAMVASYVAQVVAPPRPRPPTGAVAADFALR